MRKEAASFLLYQIKTAYCFRLIIRINIEELKLEIAEIEEDINRHIRGKSKI